MQLGNLRDNIGNRGAITAGNRINLCLQIRIRLFQLIPRAADFIFGAGNLCLHLRLSLCQILTRLLYTGSVTFRSLSDLIQIAI